MGFSNPVLVIIVLFVIMISSALIFPSSFGYSDSKQWRIVFPEGASSNKNAQFIMPITPLYEGDIVLFVNEDSTSVVIASGTPSDPNYGKIFQSGTMKKTGLFKVFSLKPGTYQFFDLIHPWMQGQFVVHEKQALVDELTTNKSSYDDGQIIQITGTVTKKLPNQHVAIKIYAVNGDVVGLHQVPVSFDNTFSVSHTAGGLMNKGQYYVDAIYGDHITQTTFDFNGIIKIQPKIEYAKTEKINYFAGEEITLNGKVSQKIGDSKVMMRLVGPSGMTTVDGWYHVLSDGTFWTFWSFDSGMEQGIYKIQASYEGYPYESSFRFNGPQISEPLVVTPSPPQIPEPAFVSPNPPQTVQEMPPWVKQIARWFGEDLITEDEFSTAIQFLVRLGIIKV